MKRRHLIGAGMAFAAGGAAPAFASTVRSARSWEMATYVCNTDNCALPPVAGANLTLSPDPSRAYDTQSVLLEHNGQKLGYLPRHIGHLVSGMLSLGIPIEAQVRRVRTAPRLKIDIALKASA
ncbi:hypothetical protein [Pelagibacterium luteolum]|nr:hypothetical protein [Pelagibacterium luteolum]